MSNIVDVLTAIKNANSSSFSVVKEKAVSDQDIVDTTLPMLLISTVNTYFNQQIHRSAIETYEIGLMIILKEGADPLTDLANKQKAVITNLFNSTSLRSLILKDSLELKNSTMSNAVKQYKNGSAVYCILNLACKVGSDF